jgi:hypothetical protein
MTYDQQNEMLRFVWRNESFRFRGFGRVRVRNETDGRPMGNGVGRSGRSSCTKSVEVGATRRPRPEERCAASRLKGRSEVTTPSLRLWSVPFDKLSAGFEAVSRRFRTRFGELQGAKKVA